jgi:hypothetical protein
MQRHLFERLNRHDVDGTSVALAEYDLTPEEQACVANSDLAGLYERGVHPVLIQAFGRLRGLKTDEIRQRLRRLPVAEPGAAPWRN